MKIKRYESLKNNVYISLTACSNNDCTTCRYRRRKQCRNSLMRDARKVIFNSAFEDRLNEQTESTKEAVEN